MGDIERRSKPGPKPGFKQSAEHIEKRKRWGAEHHAWKGDDVSPKGGRKRAKRLYPTVGACQSCGGPDAERHHIDEDTANNAPDNIAILCRRCHMQQDGRLDAAREAARRNQPVAVAARWPKTVLPG
jgi:5-methylcytosine-specific restriction endonuclease McrA